MPSSASVKWRTHAISGCLLSRVTSPGTSQPSSSYARVRIGNSLRLTRSDTSARMIPTDVRLALRGFRRAPGFFVTAVTILALGVGMSAAVYSVFRTVLVRRLPVVDQDRVVVMWTYVSDPNTDVVTGTKDLSVVRRESRTMRDVAAIAHWPATPWPFAYGERSVELHRGMVTGNFFDVLGARPALGRLLRPSDDEP